MTKHLHDFRENLIYLSLWLILFVTPILSLYVRSLNDTYITFEWTDIFIIWKNYVIFFIIFLIHNFILAPLLLYKNKKATYLISVLCVMLVFVTYQCTQHPKFPNERRMEMMNRHPDDPHLEMDRQDGNVPPDLQENNPNVNGDRGDDMHKHRFDKMGDKGKNGRFSPLFPFGGKNIIDTVIMILLLGMNLGVKLYFRAEKKEAEMKELEQRNLKTQLEYLKYQINPHFFMNTLNNIHALVDIDPEEAKTTIVELSKMMRYLLYEGNKSLVHIQREHQFVESYIALMKLRYTDKVDIIDNVPDIIPNMMMPPLLTINFIENAFKHGISYQQESYIHIELQIIGKRLFFFCKNSKHKESTKDQGGIGIANTRKRLDLLFGDSYSLEINDNENSYEVKMDIPLTDPQTVEENKDTQTTNI